MKDSFESRNLKVRALLSIILIAAIGTAFALALAGNPTIDTTDGIYNFPSVNSTYMLVLNTHYFGDQGEYIYSDNTSLILGVDGVDRLTVSPLGDVLASSYSIGANTLTTAEWAFLDGQDQSVFTSSAVTFLTVDTGQGANELYAMNQDVETTDKPTFAGADFTASIDMGATGVLNAITVRGVAASSSLFITGGISNAQRDVHIQTVNAAGDASVNRMVFGSDRNQGASEITIYEVLIALDGVDVEGAVTIDHTGQPLTVVRSTTLTGGVTGVTDFKAHTVNNMGAGYGGAIGFYIGDDTVPSNFVGSIRWLRDGDDTSGKFAFLTDAGNQLALTLNADKTNEPGGNIRPATNNTLSVGEDALRFADGYFVTVTAKNTVTGKIIENEITANPLESFEEGDLVMIMDGEYFTKTTNKLANVIGVVTLNPANIQTGTETVTEWVDEIREVTRSVSWFENVTDAYGQVYEVERTQEEPVYEWYLEMIEETLSDGNAVIYYENRTRIKTETVKVELTTEIPIIEPKNEPVLCVFGAATVKISEPVLRNDILVASGVDGKARPLRTVIPEILEQYGEMEMNLENILTVIQKLNYKTLGRVMEDSTGDYCWAMIGY